MARSKKPIDAMRTSNRASIDEQDDYKIPKGFWLLLALGLLALYSLYLVVMQTSRTGNLPISPDISTIMDPGTSSLLIVIFSASFFYETARKRGTSSIAKIAAYTLTAITVLAVIAAFVLSARSSSDSFYLIFYILFHNPYVSGLTSTAAITGSVSLFSQKLSAKNDAKELGRSVLIGPLPYH